MALRGSCQCGGVQFEVSDDFEVRSFCHCTTCKKLSGGVGTANGRLRSDEVTILQGEELLRTYQPEEGSAKTFCWVCGSNLFGGGWPESLSFMPIGVSPQDSARPYDQCALAYFLYQASVLTDAERFH